MSRTHGREGLTMIEVMVAIAVIAVLMALVIQMVNTARTTNCRVNCASNMRNIGLAILGYVNANNAFPPAGVFAEDSRTDVTTPDPSTSVIPGWINGDASRGVPMYSWVVPILPYMDQQDLLNQWTTFYDDPAKGSSCANYLDGSIGKPSYPKGASASNHEIATTSIGVLRCPDDITTVLNSGNLSYVVNGGFALWHADPTGWIGSATDGSSGPSRIYWAGLALADQLQGSRVCQKLGVMFLESTFPKGDPRKIPWNVRTRLKDIVDGEGNTLLLSENTLAGASAGSAKYSAGLETNWATPMPQFSMFIGSSNVCSTTIPATTSTVLDCTAGFSPSRQQRLLAATGTRDGPAWSHANKVGTFENINFGQTLTVEGSFPFSNSAHSGYCNMMFCDGTVRCISASIDGTVYAKLITPAGSALPLYARQLSVVVEDVPQ